MLLAWRFRCLVVVIVGITACDASYNVPLFNEAEHMPGGLASVSSKPFASFMKPAGNLPQAQRPEFYAGKALAHQPWVKAPTITTARDGLGPIYNARSCIACHLKGGRGAVPSRNDEPIQHSFVRVSIPGKNVYNGAEPDPIYGDQLQTQSIALSHQLRNIESARALKTEEPPPEAVVFIDWYETHFAYGDGEKVTLRKPSLRIEQLGYGPLHGEVLTSLRNAPPMQGVGLIELIEQQDLDRLADPGDQDKDGISGRVNVVWDPDTQDFLPGRFGLKANRPANLRTVTAAAFAGDVGITNPLFPKQPCMAVQIKCDRAPMGNGNDGFEIPMDLLDLTANFIRQLGVPRRYGIKDESLLEGRQLFYQTGCQGCHFPSYKTGASDQHPHLSHQVIWPYSDFLLHDMGPGLADGRPDFEASGSEWRTAPLWGVGLSRAVNGSHFFLHDGRARSIEEAVLWHGGEAEMVKRRFVNLSKKQRTLLLQFVESL